MQVVTAATRHPGRLAAAALLGLVLIAIPRAGHAGEVRLAVAANFLAPLLELEEAFEAQTAHDLVISSGSTGQLYAQIVNGAPFDILLAADQARPGLLAERGLGVPGSVFTYAVGRLALWSADPERVDATTLAGLGTASFRWLAIAEPDVAPYGTAAGQTLERLGLFEALEGRLVRGQNVAQAFAMTATGNAELGLVALSQAVSFEGPASYAVVPAALHDPIRQDAILLARAEGNDAAEAFARFLGSGDAARIIEAFGYGTAEPGHWQSGRPQSGLPRSAPP